MKKTIKPLIDWRVMITIVLAMAAIEITAICHGLDGKLLMFVMVALAGLAGWVIPTPKFK